MRSRTGGKGSGAGGFGNAAASSAVARRNKSGTGSRAPAVTGVLRKQGFAEVFALKGGIAAWQQASMPLEK